MCICIVVFIIFQNRTWLMHKPAICKWFATHTSDLFAHTWQSTVYSIYLYLLLVFVLNFQKLCAQACLGMCSWNLRLRVKKLTPSPKRIRIRIRIPLYAKHATILSLLWPLNYGTHTQCWPSSISLLWILTASSLPCHPAVCAAWLYSATVYVCWPSLAWGENFH